MGGLGRKKEEEIDWQSDEINENDLYHSPRPAFYANAKPSKRTQVPRDVAIPYFRFRKDRFYDWPPDPTVSRATPMSTGSRNPYDEGGGRNNSADGDFDYNNAQSNGMQNRVRMGRQYQVRNERVGLRNRSRGS